MSATPSQRRETLLQHLGEEEHYLGAVAPPMVLTSTFVFDDVASFMASGTYEKGSGYNYSRIVNPTLEMAEVKIAALEQAEQAKLFSSGMAAISAGIMSCIEAGSHVVAVDTLYGPTRSFLSSYLSKFNVEVTYVTGIDPQDFVAATRPNTTLWYLESPSSILYRLQDLQAVSALARERGVATMIDNSYASPWFQQPCAHGIDLVAHSASKYLGGHSDLVAGVLAGSRAKMMKILKQEVSLFGGILHPFGAWQILRNLRTMHLKVKAVGEAADQVAAFLKTQSWCSEVFHVGLPDFPQKELRDRQMTGWTGLMSFAPADQTREGVIRFVEALKLYQLGVSWGGHESLVVALDTHPLNWESGKWIVRLYCGLEHPQDMIEDLSQAACAAGW